MTYYTKDENGKIKEASEFDWLNGELRARLAVVEADLARDLPQDVRAELEAEKEALEAEMSLHPTFETDEEILPGYDSRLYLASELPEVPGEVLASARSRKLMALDAAYHGFIAAHFGVADLALAELLDASLKAQCDAFASAEPQNSQYDAYAAAIAAAETLDDLDAIEFKFGEPEEPAEPGV
jgi:hypothetical protein